MPQLNSCYKGRKQFSNFFQVFETVRKHFSIWPRLSGLSEGKSWFLIINDVGCVVISGQSALTLKNYCLIEKNQCSLVSKPSRMKTKITFFILHAIKTKKKDFPALSILQLALANSKIKESKKIISVCFMVTQVKIFEQLIRRDSEQMKRPKFLVIMFQ